LKVPLAVFCFWSFLKLKTAKGGGAIPKGKELTKVLKAAEDEEPEFVLAPEQVAEKVTAMPIVESRVRISKDGEYVVHETRIVDIKPISYYAKMFERQSKKSLELLKTSKALWTRLVNVREGS
jgi:hypothetical protein